MLFLRVFISKSLHLQIVCLVLLCYSLLLMFEFDLNSLTVEVVQEVGSPRQLLVFSRMEM